jgi:hypothetical protein
MTPATRQKAGSLSIAPPIGMPAGALNDPPVIDSALVIVVFGRTSAAMLSHVAAAAGIATNKTDASKR